MSNSDSLWIVGYEWLDNHLTEVVKATNAQEAVQKFLIWFDDIPEEEKEGVNRNLAYIHVNRITKSSAVIA